MDIIKIKNLFISTYIGVHDWEKKHLQTLIIDISIYTNFKSCNDKINNTVDYEKLSKSVTHYVKRRSFCLIETVAQDIARFIKKKFNLYKVKITVTKKEAIHNSEFVCVIVTR